MQYGTMLSFDPTRCILSLNILSEGDTKKGIFMRSFYYFRVK